jgi:hypothetical protein
MIAPKGKNELRLKPVRDLLPLGSGTPNAFVQAVGELNPFCPYREVRAHWIPFAIQAAKIEAERRREQSALEAQVFQDIENAIRALDRYRRHDVKTITGNFKPIFARMKEPLLGDGERQFASEFETSNRNELKGAENALGCELEFEKTNAADVARVNRRISTELAIRTLQSAKKARDDIAVCFENIHARGRKFVIARSDKKEWEISFASALGFAWRRLTGKNPSGSPESPFIQFVAAAHASLGAPQVRGSWATPCLEACKRYAADFESADHDPTLMLFTSAIWRDIPAAKGVLHRCK